MLDTNTPEKASTPLRTLSTQVRHDDVLARKIEAAARFLGVDKSTFLRAAIDREASRVIATQTHHFMTPEDAARFAAALDTPPRATERASQAAKSYRARIVDAD